MEHSGLRPFIERLGTRYLFFTGKGGVGKTSTACAAAVGLADRGRRVLLVSTDPASNLAEVLGVPVATSPTPILGVEGLFALDVDPEQAAAAYRERVIGPYRGILPDSAVARVEEQLSGACTVEIAAFDEFTALLTDDEVTAGFDHLVFDTAPTGHTLRLLALPAAWTTFIGDGTGTSCLGPLSGLQVQRDRYAAAVASLSNPALTTLLLVTRPEPAAISEADRAGAELRSLGIAAQRLIVNGVFTAADAGDPLAAVLDAQTRTALGALPAGLAGLERATVPLLAHSPMGVEGLRALAATVAAVGTGGTAAHGALVAMPSSVPLADIVEEIARAGSGLVLTMGKGGVGKTTVAAAVAVALAARGHKVRLTTTDPAAHVLDALGENVDGIEVARIDPVAETAAYTADVLASAGAGMAEDARAVLAEDLASPCTEEIAVFQAFARTVADARHGFVVLDTAPTGHTLLLLDAARSYHRELDRQSGQMPDHVVHLLDRLRDPVHTHVLLVAVPEATPVHEAARLQVDLARSGIVPTAWVLNQSLLASAPTDPVLRARANDEGRYLAEVAAGLARRTVVLPRRLTPPVGADALGALVGTAPLVAASLTALASPASGAPAEALLVEPSTGTTDTGTDIVLRASTACPGATHGRLTVAGAGFPDRSSIFAAVTDADKPVSIPWA